MSKNDITELVCIIDSSGSMESVKDETIAGFNGYIEQQRSLEGHIRVTLALFGSTCTLVFDGLPIDTIPLLTSDTYRPGGKTALYDAIGQTIEYVAMRIASPRSDEAPSAVIVAILTDGHENASVRYGKTDVLQAITYFKDKQAWNFVFLGCSAESMDEAASIGIPQRTTFVFKSSKLGTTNAFRKMSDTTTNFRELMLEAEEMRRQKQEVEAAANEDTDEDLD